MATTRRRLTKRLVEALEPGGWAWDGTLPGFGARCLPSGAVTFLVQWTRGPRGASRTRRYVLGTFGPLTVEQARSKAVAVLAEVAAGGDPAADRREVREGATVAELAERVMAEHWQPKRKPGTVRSYRVLLDGWIVPRLGRLKVADVTRAHVARLHDAMKGRPAHANRMLAAVSVMFQCAERWGLRPDGTNPARNVPHFREVARRRFLSGEELSRLGVVLREIDEGRGPRVAPLATEAVRLLLLSGLRSGELLAMRWADVDLERGFLELPDSKTGARSLPLAPAVAVVLARLPRLTGNPHVLPSTRREGAPMNELRASWYRIRAAAGLGDVRVHDLRHSHASVAAGAGESLVVIGELLGHRVPSTTRRYSHVAPSPARAAAERTSSTIAALMDGDAGKPLAPVEPMRRRT